MASLELITPHLSKIKIPGQQQIVYKDECVYSFDNPVSCNLFYNLLFFNIHTESMKSVFIQLQQTNAALKTFQY